MSSPRAGAPRRRALAAALAALAGCAPSRGRREPEPARDAAPALTDARAADAVVDGGLGVSGLGAPPADGEAADAQALRAVRAAVAAGAGYRVDEVAAGGGGSVRVVVRWPDAPLARRTSPGASPCGTPRPPSVVADELWGVPEVVVALAVSAGKDWPARRAQAVVVLGDCALTPRLTVLAPGDRLAVQSADARPWLVQVHRRAGGELGRVGPELAARKLALPWQGHEVVLSSEVAAWWQLELPGPHGADDAAHVWWAPHPYAAVTDGDGLAVLGEVPVGEHEVVAYLPARGGGRASTLRAKVTVTAREETEVVLTP